MRIVRSVVGALCAAIACAVPAFSQGEAALPFLLFSPSTEANGMGGTTVALGRLEPLAAVFSPSQIGLLALTSHARFGFYPPSASGLPVVLPDMQYGAWSASTGILLNDLTRLPLKIGVGLAYHRVDFDLGSFVVTSSSGPQPVGKFEATEEASGFVLGIGMEYFARLGFGYTFRSVGSHLTPMSPEGEQGTGDAHVKAADYGAMLEVPLVSIVEGITGDEVIFAGELHPSLGISAGVGWNNVGDNIVYIDPAQADPLPRTARAGIAVMGDVQLGNRPGWELLSGAWSREAEDLLVVRHADGRWEYQSGLGDVQFGTNILRGDLTANVTLRSGWQVRVLEVVTFRTGKIETPPARGISYDTRGWTVQLAGLVKAIALIAGDTTPYWLVFVRDHLDVQYHAATMTRPMGEDLSSSALTLEVHGWLW